ncbi:DoxX family membrane protein [Micromonospora endolithica]|uniref:DoxX family membrane protein n=2 Tax=Micromonospora endolithica TaxID=230091 RepID=A0A3A9YZQ7_9ACTN|nr:DoxX family membrane protein [Micromonospora endolithica]TWJ21724.1 thiosulfate dehydrogenase [quinone] large subunit [Micromonospora endolithica]
MTATIERNTAATIAPAAETPRERATRYVFAGIRIALGWTFLWAFLDKVFGLGFATEAKNAWIEGGSPTKGFLTFGAAGPFKGLYNDIAGAAWADWLFMIGLAGIGVALLLGIGMRVAAVAGGLLYVLMWTVVLPPENNPFMDDHLISAAILAALALVGAGDTLGLGRTWAKLPLVQRFPWLR